MGIVKRVSINQPSFMPWCGYFEYIHHSDIFVYFDDVQYSTSGWSHRNKIKIHDGNTMWLTIPIVTKDKFNRIKDVRINYKEDWIKKHKNSTIIYYGRAKSFNLYKDEFFRILDKRHIFLADLDWDLLMFYCKSLGLNRKIIKSSDISVDGGGAQRVINICEELGATHYYASGVTSRHLYNPDEFKAKGITLEYQDFKHPEYRQLWGDFVPFMGVLDLLFNVGKESIEVILSGRKNKASETRIVDLKYDNKFLPQYVDLRNRYVSLLLSSAVDITVTEKWLETADIEIRGIVKDDILLGVVILYLHKDNEVTFFVKEPGKGWGTMLLGLVEKVAKERKLDYIWSWVLSDNTIAQRVFEKAGFTKEEICERNYKGNLRYGFTYKKTFQEA